MCENPCKIFGIKNKGFIKEGYDADFTIVDMNKEQTIKDEMIAVNEVDSLLKYKVKGFPVGTIVNGTLIMSEGKIISKQKVTFEIFNILFSIKSAFISSKINRIINCCWHFIRLIVSNFSYSSS